MFADLHFHSTHSDGKHSVEWLATQLRRASQDAELKLAVLTDHDGAEGFNEFRDALKDTLPILCGSELSCTATRADGRESELHLLVYGIDPLDPEFKAHAARFKNERRERFFRIAKRLNDAGLKFDAEAFAARHTGALGRPHIADALIEAGHVQSREEAFDLYLKAGRPFADKKWRFPLEEAVEFARRKNCRSSVAHPGQNGFNFEDLKSWKALGVDAIEVYHPRHDATQTEQFKSWAEQLNFKISGGSDFHTAETDLLLNGTPRLGRTAYPMEKAYEFLGDLIA